MFKSLIVLLIILKGFVSETSTKHKGASLADVFWTIIFDLSISPSPVFKSYTTIKYIHTSVFLSVCLSFPHVFLSVSGGGIAPSELCAADVRRPPLHTSLHNINPLTPISVTGHYATVDES